MNGLPICLCTRRHRVPHVPPDETYCRRVTHHPSTPRTFAVNWLLHCVQESSKIISFPRHCIPITFLSLEFTPKCVIAREALFFTHRYQTNNNFELQHFVNIPSLSGICTFDHRNCTVIMDVLRRAKGNWVLHRKLHQLGRYLGRLLNVLRLNSSIMWCVVKRFYNRESQFQNFSGKLMALIYSVSLVCGKETWHIIVFNAILQDCMISCIYSSWGRRFLLMNLHRS